MNGKIGIVAERYISMGFELVGIKDVFIRSGQEAASTVDHLISQNEYALIVCEEKIKESMEGARVRELETSINPLVIFIPSYGASGNTESVSVMAKRILGVKIGNIGEKNER